MPARRHIGTITVVAILIELINRDVHCPRHGTFFDKCALGRRVDGWSTACYRIVRQYKAGPFAVLPKMAGARGSCPTRPLLPLGLDSLQVLPVDVCLDITAVEAAVTVGIAVDQHLVHIGLVTDRPGALNLTGVDIAISCTRTDAAVLCYTEIWTVYSGMLCSIRAYLRMNPPPRGSSGSITNS